MIYQLDNNDIIILSQILTLGENYIIEATVLVSHFRYVRGANNN